MTWSVVAITDRDVSLTDVQVVLLDHAIQTLDIHGDIQRNLYWNFAQVIEGRIDYNSLLQPAAMLDPPDNKEHYKGYLEWSFDRCWRLWRYGDTMSSTFDKSCPYEMLYEGPKFEP